MNIELERILGTLEVITEAGIGLRLPNTDTAYLVPFVWDVTQKGEFNFINFGLDERWITKTDIKVAIESWQTVERKGYLNEDDYPDCFDDDVIFISPEVAEKRAKIYQILEENIQRSLHNIEVLKFSLYPGGYSFFAILGESQDNTWFAFSETVAREIELENEITVFPLSDLVVNDDLNSHALNLKNEFQNIINQLEPVSVIGYYGGGYDYRFNHHLVQGVAFSKEKALLIALQQGGMLNMANFHKFNISALEWQYDENEMAELTPKYQKINDFFKQNLSNSKMIRCSFWNYDRIYVIGQTISKDFAGVSIGSEFNFNP